MSSGVAYSLLVPIDYSHKSVLALATAARFVNKYDGIVHVLHIIDDKPFVDKEKVENERHRLFEFAQEQQKELNITIIPNVITGNIFISIGQTARKLGAQMIIMGVHKLQGIQFIIGSFALRVALSSTVPVLLVNSNKPVEKFERIVLPFDTNLQMDWMVRRAIELAKDYNGIVYLFSILGGMSFFRKRKALRKIKNATELIRSEGLRCENDFFQYGKASLSDSIIRFSEFVNTDIIALPMDYAKNKPAFLNSQTVMNLIENSSIPLYVLNQSKY